MVRASKCGVNGNASSKREKYDLISLPSRRLPPVPAVRPRRRTPGSRPCPQIQNLHQVAALGPYRPGHAHLRPPGRRQHDEDKENKQDAHHYGKQAENQKERGCEAARIICEVDCLPFKLQDTEPRQVLREVLTSTVGAVSSITGAMPSMLSRSATSACSRWKRW